MIGSHSRLTFKVYRLKSPKELVFLGESGQRARPCYVLHTMICIAKVPLLPTSRVYPL